MSVLQRVLFALRYGYRVPEEVLEYIDLRAEIDESLTVSENLRLLLDKYPILRRFVARCDGNCKLELDDDSANRAYLAYIADLAETGDEWALAEMRRLGYKSLDELLDGIYRVDGYIILDRWLEKPLPPEKPRRIYIKLTRWVG